MGIVTLKCNVLNNVNAIPYRKFSSVINVSDVLVKMGGVNAFVVVVIVIIVIVTVKEVVLLKVLVTVVMLVI